MATAFPSATTTSPTCRSATSRPSRRSCAPSPTGPGRAPLWFDALPQTIAALEPSRLNQIFAPWSGGRTCGLMISDAEILGDPSRLATASSTLRDMGINVALRSTSFSRSTLETLVLLRPELVGLSASRLLGTTPDPVRLRELRRELRVIVSLGALPFLEGVVADEDRALAQELGIEVGVGAALGKLVLVPTGP